MLHFHIHDVVDDQALAYSVFILAGTSLAQGVFVLPTPSIRISLGDSTIERKFIVERLAILLTLMPFSPAPAAIDYVTIICFFDLMALMSILTFALGFLFLSM